LFFGRLSKKRVHKEATEVAKSYTDERNATQQRCHEMLQLVSQKIAAFIEGK
jgi:hypothetical protein